MSVIGWVIYIIAIVAMFYFIGIKPSQKERKKQEALLASVAVGDTVLTTSGFYGVIIDMTDDTVIVEFLLQFLAQLIIAHCADRTAIESEL